MAKKKSKKRIKDKKLGTFKFIYAPREGTVYWKGAGLALPHGRIVPWNYLHNTRDKRYGGT